MRGDSGSRMGSGVSSMRGRWLVALLVSVASLGCADAEGPFALSIREARRAPAGTSLTIEGVATSRSGLFRSFTGEDGFFVQDATAGIYVSTETNPEVARGTRVRVTGVAGDLFRLEAIVSDPARIVPLDVAPVPPAAEVATGAVGAENEGSLIRLTARITQAIVDDLPYGYRIFVDDGSGEVQVYVARSAFDPTTIDWIRPGAEIAAVGVSGRFEETREVLPRAPSDLTPVDGSASGV